MIKTYSSPAIKFIIHVKKDGKPLQIEFDGYDPVNKLRTKVITDREISEQMERSNDFTVYFHLVSEIHDEPIDKTPITVILPQPKIELSNDIVKKDVTEAKRWLNSIGVPYSKLKNRESVMQEARNNGYNLLFD